MRVVGVFFFLFYRLVGLVIELCVILPKTKDEYKVVS